MSNRFKMQVGIAKFNDTLIGKEYSEYNIEEIVSLLNRYDTEIEQLKKENRLLKQRSEKVHFAKEYQKLYNIRSVSPNGVIKFVHGKKPSWRMKDVRQIKKELPPLEELTMRQLFEIKNRYNKFGQNVVGRIVYNIYQGTFDEYL